MTGSSALPAILLGLQRAIKSRPWNASQLWLLVGPKTQLHTNLIEEKIFLRIFMRAGRVKEKPR